MDDRDDRAPPPRRRLPEAWYDEAIAQARRNGAHAEAMARTLETVFDTPLDEDLRDEVLALAAWLRSHP